jgi:hypothetical protein
VIGNKNSISTLFPFYSLPHPSLRQTLDISFLGDIISYLYISRPQNRYIISYIVVLKKFNFFQNVKKSSTFQYLGENSLKEPKKSHKSDIKDIY